MVKVESRKQGKIDFNSQSAEVRAKLPIGKKFSLSAGVMYRTHERPYGYNPIQIWLNEADENGNAVNCKTILESLLQMFNCRIFQQNGQWTIISLDALGINAAFHIGSKQSSILLHALL